MSTPDLETQQQHATPPATDPKPSASRLMSVDALRGFDMFWIIGGEEVARSLEEVGGGPVVSTIATQLKHVEWNGFRFYDAIFPLFLFLIGISIVLSIDRLLETKSRKEALIRIARRSLLLFGIGVFYYGGISRPWPDIALSGVLPRIALCYLVAAALYVFVPRKGIIMAAAACLLGYWAMMSFIPFPDVQLKHASMGKKGSQAEAKSAEALLAGVNSTVRGTFEEGHNLAHYVDFQFLPGKKRNLYYTNEGLLSTISAVATTLFGIMAGWLLTSRNHTPHQRVAWLIGGGLAAIAVGALWGIQFPIIKRIWTSSFCLVASGVASVLMGLFYLVIDVRQKRFWCTPFLWIGSNALVVYLAANLLEFEALAARFVGGDVKAFLDSQVMKGLGGLVVSAVGLLLPVLFVRFLYQRKIFIRL